MILKQEDKQVLTGEQYHDISIKLEVDENNVYKVSANEYIFVLGSGLLAKQTAEELHETICEEILFMGPYFPAHFRFEYTYLHENLQQELVEGTYSLSGFNLIVNYIKTYRPVAVN